MKISSIHIHSFAGVRQVDLSFDEHITVIEGNNEAGKSSITAFIRFMLYGFQSKDERERYIHWGEQTAEGSMDIQFEGSLYRIHRVAQRSTPREQVEIVDLSANTTLPSTKSPAEQFLGVPVQVYDNTAYISQLEGSRVGGKDISAAIENLMFSADENVSTAKALKRLDEARIELLYKNRKGGKLYDLEQKRIAIRAQIDAARRTQDAAFRTEGELATARAAYEEAKANLDRAKSRQETHAKLWTEQRYRRFGALIRQKREAERVVEDLTARYTFDGQVVTREEVTKLYTLQADLVAKDEQIAALEDEMATITEQEQRERVSPAEAESAAQAEAAQILDGYRASIAEKKKNIPRAIGAASVAVLLCVLAILFRTTAGLCLGFALAGSVSLLLAAICGAKAYGAEVYRTQVLRQYRATDEKTLDRVLDSVRGQAKVRSNRLARYKELDERRRSLIGRKELGGQQVEAFCMRFRTRDLAQTIACAERAANDLEAARANAERVRLAYEAFYEANRDLDILKAQEAPHHVGEEAQLPPAEEFEQAVARARAEMERTRDVMHELEKQVTTLQAGAQSLTELEESLVPLAQEEARCRRHYNALCLAHETLEQAASSLRNSLAPALSQTASHYMGIATEGKYTTIGVGDHLALEYRASEPGATNHSTGYLSAGTQDLAYISLRLALIRHLYAVAPTVVFDETFARLDEHRMRAMMRILSQCAMDGMQVILLTSQAREARILSQITGFAYVQI